MYKEEKKLIFSIVAGILVLCSLFFSRANSVSFGGAVSTLMPVQGGTGTSTIPTYGQLLVGNSLGTYTLTATSSLGIVSGGGGNSKWATSTNGTDIQPNTSAGIIVSASSTFIGNLFSRGPFYASSTALFTNGFTTYASSSVISLHLSGLSAGSLVTDADGLVRSLATSSVSSASTAVYRDSSQNAFANNFVSKATNVVSAGGTTVLTAASSRKQNLTGTNTQTFQLPDATTLAIGATFEFSNNSTGLLTVTDGGGGAIMTIPYGSYAQIYAIAVSTTAGAWDYHFMLPSNVQWGTLGISSVFQASSTALFGQGFTAYGSSTLQAFTATNATVASLNLNSPTSNITVSGSNATSTIILTAGGATGNITGPAVGPTQVEFVTNQVNIWVMDYASSTLPTPFCSFWNIAMPNSYDGGSLQARFLWTATTSSGTVNWGIRAGSFVDGTALDTALSATSTIQDTLLSANQLHVSSWSAPFTPTNATPGNQLMVFHVCRGAGDTLNTNARLMEVVLGYKKRQFSD